MVTFTASLTDGAEAAEETLDEAAEEAKDAGDEAADEAADETRDEAADVTDSLVAVEAIRADLVGTDGAMEGLAVTSTGGLGGVGGGLVGGVGTYE